MRADEGAKLGEQGRGNALQQARWALVLWFKQGIRAFLNLCIAFAYQTVGVAPVPGSHEALEPPLMEGGWPQSPRTLLCIRLLRLVFLFLRFLQYFSLGTLSIAWAQRLYALSADAQENKRPRREQWQRGPVATNTTWNWVAPLDIFPCPWLSGHRWLPEGTTRGRIATSIDRAREDCSKVHRQ